MDEFHHISDYEILKEAWNALTLTKKESSKESKLRFLTSQFEYLKMRYIETFGQFYAHFCDVTNASSTHGEKIP